MSLFDNNQKYTPLGETIDREFAEALRLIFQKYKETPLGSSK